MCSRKRPSLLRPQSYLSADQRIRILGKFLFRFGMSIPRPRPIALIEAPSPLGLRPQQEGAIPGTRRMPDVLREAGLWSDVPLASEVRLPEPNYSAEPDRVTGVRNLKELVPYTRRIADAVSRAHSGGQTPVIIGGDCSVLLGPVLALRKLGRFALVHVDGHADFAHEGNRGEPYPNVAGADLAIVTGRGPKELANLNGLVPYVRDDDVIQLGEKDEASDPNYWFKDFPQTAIRRYPLSVVRAEGLAAVLDKICSQLSRAPIIGFWAHIDLDVLDSNIMPAVDSPQPTGFSWEELDLCLQTLWQHPKLTGVDFTIYDPDRDPSRTYARELALHVRRMLQT